MEGVVKPTVVLGVGKAGCRMASAVADLAEAEGAADQFAFVTLDTNSEDLYRYSPDRATPLHIEKHAGSWENDRETFGYLHPEFELGVGEGTQRNRAVSRYFVEHRETLYDLQMQLQRTINDFVEERANVFDANNVADVNVWLLHSLGGGTGSGSFPLIGAMLYNVTDANPDYDFFIGGIGSLPRLEQVSTLGVPEGNREHFTNSYAALSELKTLIGHDCDPYPIDLSLEDEHESIPQDTITLPESPFGRYYLLGYEEGEGRNYRKQMNDVAATAVFYFSRLDSVENHPDQGGLVPDGTHLFTMNASEIRAPIEDMREYVSLGEEIAELDRRIGEREDGSPVEGSLTARIEAREADIEYLEDFRKLEIDYRELPEADTAGAVDTEFLRQLRQAVNDFEPTGVEEREVDIDERLDRFEERMDDYVHDGAFEVRDAVERVYCEMLFTRLNELVSGHRFNDRVEEVWNDPRFNDELESELPYLSDDDPVDKWTNGMLEYLQSEGRELKDELESISFRPLKKRRIRSQLEEMRESVGTLQSYYQEFEALRELREEARSRSSSTYDRLLARKGELETEATDLRREKQAAKAEREAKENSLRRKRDQLTSARKPTAGAFDLPLETLDGLTSETVEAYETLGELVDAGLVNQTKLGQALVSRIDAIESDDGVQDRQVDKSVSTKSILGMMSHGSNVDDDGPAGNLLETEVPNSLDVDEALQKFDYWDPDETFVETAEGFSFWMVAEYAPVSLLNTSEYGAIHEVYDDPDRSIGDLFGHGYTDEEVTLNFAYPELATDNGRVRAAFAKPTQED